VTAVAIETIGLRKRFGARRAVEDLSLSVGRGEVLGFLGPNGAGKTTSIKMLLGLIEPSGGRATLLGAPIGDRATRARVGFLPEHFRFQDWLTGRELLELHGRLCGLSRSRIAERSAALLARVDLEDAADRRLGGYSKGMLQRLGLAVALVAGPELVFLDEPTSGLDPLGRLMVRDVIRELREQGVTVFLNSHLLGEVEVTCDRVVFVRRGRIVHEHRMADEAGGFAVRLRAAPLDGETLAGLERLAPGLERDGDEVRMRVATDAVLPEIARWIVSRGAALHHLSATRDTLEELFVRVMAGERTR
jgi:ABC-2 type transport system ATP-binding protein